MEQLLKQLRRFYYIISAPALAAFGAALLLADRATLSVEADFYIKTSLFLLTLICVPLTSFVFKRSLKKIDTLSEPDFLKTAGRSYRFRIVTLSVISYACSLLYFLTADSSYSMIFVIMTVFILLLYPTAGLFGYEKTED